MDVKTFNQLLSDNPEKPISILLPTGEVVPNHFHITEVSKVTKKFIDCGGTYREDSACALQVWVANDYDHRLDTTKLRKIMGFSEKFVDADLPLIVEYGSETISQYPLMDVKPLYSGLLLMLGKKPTECLAPDKCGIKKCDEGCCC